MSITYKDLAKEVDLLNKKYKKSDKTFVKFAVSRAYGGNQIVIRDNKSGGVQEVTYGYRSARETMNDLRLKMPSLKRDLDYFHKRSIGYRKKNNLY